MCHVTSGRVLGNKVNVGGQGLLAVWAGRRAATALLCWLALTRRCAAVAALSCGVAVGAGATGSSSE